MLSNGVPLAHHDYDAANQVLGWSYDAAGNLLDDGTRASSYDALDRLSAVTATGQTRSYSYNGDGVLVAQTANGSTTRYTQDLAAAQSDILQTQVVSGTTTDYLYGRDRLAALSGGTRTWYLADRQGSVRSLLAEAGTALVAPRNYDPWGTREGAASSDPFGYTGELQDAAVGRLYLRARWYQPGAGQFTSRNPLEDASGLAYAYATDTPRPDAIPPASAPPATARRPSTSPAWAGRGRVPSRSSPTWWPRAARWAQPCRPTPRTPRKASTRPCAPCGAICKIR